PATPRRRRAPARPCPRRLRPRGGPPPRPLVRLPGAPRQADRAAAARLRRRRARPRRQRPRRSPAGAEAPLRLTFSNAPGDEERPVIPSRRRAPVLVEPIRQSLRQLLGRAVLARRRGTQLPDLLGQGLEP